MSEKKTVNGSESEIASGSGNKNETETVSGSVRESGNGNANVRNVVCVEKEIENLRHRHVVDFAQFECGLRQLSAAGVKDND